MTARFDHRIIFLIIFIAIFFSKGSTILQAQNFSIDTSGFFNESNSKEVIPAFETGPSGFEYPDDLLTEDDENSYVPADIIFVPSEVLYNNRWDTLYIRTGRNDFSNWHDTIPLLLNNPTESAFHFPHKGKLLSRYGVRGGRFHAGMDIKLELGDTIVSAFDGKVRVARVMSGYGKMVVVRHTNGLETVYGHMSKILVNINDEVKAGSPLGLGGRTGRASTTHLHFETRFLGEHFDPGRIIDFENYSLTTDTLIVNKNFWKAGSAHSPAVATSQGAKKYHVIHSGETLSAVSRKYKVSVDDLCRLNGIKKTKVLQIGTRVRVK